MKWIWLLLFAATAAIAQNPDSASALFELRQAEQSFAMRRNNMPKPDFSGTWKFNPRKSVLQIPAPDSSIFVVEHREPVFRIRRTHVFGQKSDTFSLDLTTDGKEVTVDRGEAQIRARVYWEDDILVFDTRIVKQGEEATNRVRYKLAETLNSFTAEEHFRSKSLSYDNVWVMDKE